MLKSVSLEFESLHTLHPSYKDPLFVVGRNVATTYLVLMYLVFVAPLLFVWVVGLKFTI